MLDKLSPSVGRFDALKFKLYSDHVGERIRRDRSHTFYEWDPKGGYYKGSTGTFRDYIDPEITTKQSIGIALEEGKRQWKLFKEDINYYYGWKDRDPECVDGVDFDVPPLSSLQSHRRRNLVTFPHLRCMQPAYLFVRQVATASSSLEVSVNSI